MSDLQRDLGLLAAQIEWPVEPDLAPRVRARLAPRPARRGRAPRRLVLVLAAALVLLAALMAAVPSARDAVRDLFGLDGATVEVRDRLPGRDAVTGLDLGPRVTLAEAERAAGFDVLEPVSLGAPSSVHLRRAVPGGEVTLRYPGPLLVTEFRGDLAPEYVGKIADSEVQRLPNGLYVSGAPHFFFYRSPDGAIREDTLRLARDVLLLERGRLLVRIEGAGSLERARRIAASLR